MTTNAATTDPRYPVGQFSYPGSITDVQRQANIQILADLPARMRAAVKGLSDQQLDTPYRDGGWSVRQVVHHVPDSHMNAFIRFRLALTEDHPTIKPYDEKAWANLADAKAAPEVSLNLLEALHERWVLMLKGITSDHWKRTLNHPDAGEMDLHKLIALYGWHSRHHLAHITHLRQRMGW